MENVVWIFLSDITNSYITNIDIEKNVEIGADIMEMFFY